MRLRSSIATISAATSASSRPVRSIRVTSSIRRIQVSWRRAKRHWARFIASDVAGEQLVEADRGPRGARGPGRGRRCAPRPRRPAATISVDPRLDPGAQLVAVDRQPDQQRSAPAALAPQAARRRVRRRSRAARARSAARSACGRSGARRRRARARARRAAPRARARRAPPRPRPGPPTAPAGAARARRAPRAGRGRCRRRRSGAGPRRAARRSRRARARRTGPAENSSSTPGDPEQPVLEPRALRRRRRSAENLEPAVDLDRVAGDRHRVLAALAQQLGDLDRDAGLADRGRAEDRQDAHWRRATRRG